MGGHGGRAQQQNQAKPSKTQVNQSLTAAPETKGAFEAPHKTDRPHGLLLPLWGLKLNTNHTRHRLLDNRERRAQYAHHNVLLV
jgi:hypothetical protein